MRLQFNVILFSVYVIAAISSCQQESEIVVKPNVVLVFVDDLGYGDLSCFNVNAPSTPHIDQLANEGIRFTDFYVPATVCTPSRAGLMTGKYPIKLGLHKAVLYPFSENGLPTEEYTMAEMLRDGGYSTYCIGKWHLGHKEEFMPNNQGFDYFYGVPYSNDMNNYFYKHNEYQSPPLPLYRNKTVLERNPNQKYLTRKFTNEAQSVIERDDDSPFFIYLPHVMPHLPLHVSEEFENISNKGLYGDVVTELDWSVGQIIKSLKKVGKYDNTILIFTSDNGPVLRVGGSAGVLRGQKAETWEGGQRIPCIVSWPKVIPREVISSEVVSTLDLFPTLARIANVELSDELNLDGRDLAFYLLNPQQIELDDHPFFYYSRNGNLEAIRYGFWKLHIGKERSKDLYNENGEFSPLLFNLATDLSEQNDLSTNNPQIVNQLQSMIKSDNPEINNLQK